MRRFWKPGILAILLTGMWLGATITCYPTDDYDIVIGHPYHDYVVVDDCGWWCW